MLILSKKFTNILIHMIILLFFIQLYEKRNNMILFTRLKEKTIYLKENKIDDYSETLHLANNQYRLVSYFLDEEDKSTYTWYFTKIELEEKNIEEQFSKRYYYCLYNQTTDGLYCNYDDTLLNTIFNAE